MINHDIKGLPPGAGKKDEELYDWIENTNETTKRFLEKKNARYLHLKIDDPNAGSHLSEFLEEHLIWEHKNKNMKRH